MIREKSPPVTPPVTPPLRSKSEPVRTEFETHLSICSECVDYLDSYKRTIEVVRKACTEDERRTPPKAVPEKLIQAILAARKQAE